MAWIFPLSLLIFFELVADVLSKEWSLHGSWLRWTGAILGYVVANLFWLFALKEGSGLAKGAVIFSVASAIIAVFIGEILYKENLTTTQLVGVGLGIISLVFIFWP
jgi:glucose uptake protein GlcU